ncbi:MAG: cell wall hydrolase [bacterium]|nr:cell wall hydrolase [bacterium]
MGAGNKKLSRSAAVIMAVMVVSACIAASTAMVAAGSAEHVDALQVGAELVLDTDTLSAGVALILDTELTLSAETTQEAQSGAGTRSARQPEGEPAGHAADTTGADTASAGAAEADETQDAADETAFVMTNVQNTLNVRAQAGEDAAIIGRLYADCYGEILERGDEWTLLRSGSVVGWAKNDYLLFDEEAQEALSQVGRWTATANESGLRIRKAASTDSGVYALLAQGDIVDIYEDLGEWLKVAYDGSEGYVSAEYVTVDLLCATGETMQEITAREAAEAEARRKAQEEAAARRAALSEEQANVEANYSDVQLLAALIWCEAGNQSYEGQLAVGAVVMNRVNHPAYPNTISGVIYAPGQFTPAMTGRVARALQRGVPDSCTQAAIEAMSGVSNVGGVLHFNVKTLRSSDLIIGDHAFW